MLKLLVVLSLLAGSFALRCYVCNSLVDKYCAANGFDPQKAADYEEQCPSSNTGGCRILVQTGEAFDNRDIRECAATPESDSYLHVRGNKGIEVKITTCDFDLCNSASTVQLSKLIAVIFATTTAAAAIFFRTM